MHNLEHRVGRYRLSRSVSIDWDAMLAIARWVVVIDVRHYPRSRTVVYEAFSPLFDEVGDSEETPCYEWVITKSFVDGSPEAPVVTAYAKRVPAVAELISTVPPESKLRSTACPTEPQQPRRPVAPPRRRGPEVGWDPYGD